MSLNEVLEGISMRDRIRIQQVYKLPECRSKRCLGNIIFEAIKSVLNGFKKGGEKK